MTIVSYRLNEKGGIFFGSGGFNAVSQIHHVPRGPRALQNFVRALPDDLVRRVEYGGIEIALHAPASAQTRLHPAVRNAITPIRHVDGPVQAHHVHPRGRHALHERARVLNVSDRGNFGMVLFDAFEDLLLIRGGEFVVVAGTQMSRPRVENLNELRTVFNLEASVVANVVGKFLKNTMEQFGLRHGHFLDFKVFFAGLAFHQVGGERVGASHKTKDGCFWPYFVAQSFKNFGNKGCTLVWVYFVELGIDLKKINV